MQLSSTSPEAEPQKLSMSKVLSHAPVTCVSLLPPTTSLVFRGGFATSYNLQTLALEDQSLLFDEGRVHGISYHESLSSSSAVAAAAAAAAADAPPLPRLLALVWGVRQVLLVHVYAFPSTVFSSSSSSSSSNLATLSNQFDASSPVAPSSSLSHYHYRCRPASTVPTTLSDLVHSGRIIRKQPRAENDDSTATVVDDDDCSLYVVCCAMAHNFLDLLSILPPSSSSSSSSSISSSSQSLPSYTLHPYRRVTHPTRLITYSLTLHGSSLDSLLLASGTVQNTILLWTIKSATTSKPSGSSSLALEGGSSGGSTLTGHEGVIFRLLFSSYRSERRSESSSSSSSSEPSSSPYPDLLASCSDDRSVRLWERFVSTAAEEAKAMLPTFVPLWVGWGHSARVWDLTVTSKHLLSSGEDGDIRVWDLPSSPSSSSSSSSFSSSTTTSPSTVLPLATLSGHASSSSVWRVSSSFATSAELGVRDGACSGATIVDDGRVISGGNDGAAKVWDVEYFVDSCRTDDSDHRHRHAVEWRDPSPPPSPDVAAAAAAAAALPQAPLPPPSAAQPPLRPSGAPAASAAVPVVVIIAVRFFPQLSLGAVVCATSKGGLYVFDREGGASSSSSSTTSATTDEKHVGRWIRVPQHAEAQGPQQHTATTAMETHPSDAVVALGTSDGRVNVVDVRRSLETKLPHLAGCFGVQCLNFLSRSFPSSDDNNILFASHVNGFIICYDLTSRIVLRVLSAQSRGGFVACLTGGLWPERMLLCGDSRGGIHLFSWGDDESPIAGSSSCFATRDDSALASQSTLMATSSVDRYHGRDIVSSILCTGEDRRTVYTIGHDGYFRTVAVVNRRLIPMLSQPIGYANSLTHLFINPFSKSVLIGGYRERTFKLWDVTSGFELLQFECGGWKRPSDLDISSATARNGDPNFSYAYGAVGDKSNSSPTIHVRGVPRLASSVSSCERRRPVIASNFGVPFHGLPVYSVEGFPDPISPNKTIFVTGSEDCTVKVTSFDSATNSFTLLHDLPNSLSCVRSIASSTPPRDAVSGAAAGTTLIVVGGGRLHLQFYEFIPDNFGHAVRFLCENDPPKHATIDHRINALVSAPLGNNAAGRHVVVAGDSDGNISIIEVDIAESRCGTLTDGVAGMPERRPILSIDLVSIGWPSRNNSKVLDFVMVAGDTSGRIGIWGVTLAQCNVGGVPSTTTATPTLIHVLKAHQCGANAISAVIVDRGNSRRDLVIASGGDDQALCVFKCSLSESFEMTRSTLTLIPNASSSALKSVAYFPDQALLYAVGYDQRLAAWSVRFNSSNPDESASLNRVSLNMSSVADVSALCAIPNVSGTSATVAVVGTGIELFKVELSEWKTTAASSSSSSLSVPESERLAVMEAAKALAECNFVLLTCGAGMSADSGLPTYENLAASYRELCDPLMMCTDYERFAGFWEQTANKYLEAEPHEGYEVISSWLKPRTEAQQPLLPNLSSFYCYTSNVDGHVLLSSAFEEGGGGGGVCEIHGRATDLWRCASLTGYREDGVTERMGDTWTAFNRKAKEAGPSCRGNEVQGRVCSQCGGPTRPSVLLFNDSDCNLYKSIDAQRCAYQVWEAAMSDAVADAKKKLVVLEIGCGLNVPAVRVEGGTVVLDLLRRVGSGRENDCVLIRVNLKDCGHVDGVDVEVEEGEEELLFKRYRVISVKGTAVEAIKWIDEAIKRALLL